ncbi:MAG: DEAD/DEAH box helicase [DPANN group archaeon]|nr:DEAD/DEAH box helicase [DPANN group archaeon]
MDFKELGLDPQLIKAIEEMGYKEPTEIQKETIPLIKSGRDVFGQSCTGSGKTAAFGLPILEKISHQGKIQVLALVPTRELCEQVANEFIKFSKYKPVKVTTVYGGVAIGPQIRNLCDSDIVVGTPGRILDHLSRRTLDLRNVSFLVLDEADKMLEMGFIDDVEDILRHVPKQRQTLLFSATISSEIVHISQKHMINPQKVETKIYFDKSKLKQIYYNVLGGDKFSLLVHLLKKEHPKMTIIFCATRRRVDLVAGNLRKQGINVLPIHGGLTQARRTQIMESVKAHKVDGLVATDVAASGIDIKNVTHIFNYDLPKTSKEYLHRIGRTARADETGMAISLLSREDHENFRHVMMDRELEIEPNERPQFQKLQFEAIRTEQSRFGQRRFSGHGQNTEQRHGQRTRHWR